MERLKYWFGGRHSTVSQYYSDLANENKGDSEEKHIPNKNKDLPEVDFHFNEKHELSIKTASQQTNQEAKTSENTSENLSAFRKLIPLQEGDCLSCKLIAVGTFMSFSFLALYLHVVSRGRYHGKKKMLLTAFDFGIIGGGQYLAFCRFFDHGIYAKKKNTDIQETVEVKES